MAYFGILKLTFLNSELEKLSKDLSLGSPLAKADFDGIAGQIDFAMPGDYAEFMMSYNGGEGFIGSNYLQLWKAQDIIALNEEYNVDEFAPGYFVFGSNGGGTAFAFHKQTHIVVSFEFVGMLIADEPRVLGETFVEFLESLAES